MLSRLVHALRVFVASLLGAGREDPLPEIVPHLPTVAQRLGYPFSPPTVVVTSRRDAQTCLARVRSAIGEENVSPLPAAPASKSHGAVRVKLAGRLRLPGILQRQRAELSAEQDGPRTHVTLTLASPNGQRRWLLDLLSVAAPAVITVFIFLTWITGPADIDLLLVALVSFVLGLVASAPIQGILHHRANTKERVRLARTGARLASLLDGHVARWP